MNIGSEVDMTVCSLLSCDTMYFQSLRLINRAESSKIMVPIYHQNKSATNPPNYVVLC